jgi:hypothetical protein
MGFEHHSHPNNARQHAIKRAFERWGIVITNAEYLEMSKACESGHAPLIAESTRTKGSTVHAVKHRDRELWAIFNPSIGCIATFLKCGKPEDIRHAVTVKAT